MYSVEPRMAPLGTLATTGFPIVQISHSEPPKTMHY